MSNYAFVHKTYGESCWYIDSTEDVYCDRCILSGYTYPLYFGRLNPANEYSASFDWINGLTDVVMLAIQ